MKHNWTDRQTNCKVHYQVKIDQQLERPFSNLQSKMADILKRTVVQFILWIVVTFQSEASGFKRVCYYTNWSESRAVVDFRFHLKEHLDPFLCTHLIYAFANINPTELRIERVYSSEDDGKVPGSGFMFDFTALKKKNPKLKTILSIGGEHSGEFQLIMGSDKNIKTFAQNIYIYIRDRNFDGIDIDWEYPGAIYKNEFVIFLKELRAVFAAEAKQTGNEEKSISIAGAPGISNIETSYNITEIVKYVDFINVMAYDYSGPWSHKTGFMAPLYSRSSDKSFDQTLSQNWTMNKYLELGAPPEKLVMGIHGAGSSFTLANNSNHGIGDAVSGGGEKGPLLKFAGRLAYPEICKMRKEETVYDEEQKQKYTYYGSQWVGYEDPDTILMKVQYAINNNFSGVMFWSLDLDDFLGSHCHQGKYPLLSVVKKVSELLAQNTTPDPTHSQPIKTKPTTTTVWPPKDGGFKLFIIDSRNSTPLLTFPCLILLLLFSLCVLFINHP